MVDSSLERVSKAPHYSAGVDSQIAAQMRQFYEDLDTLESGLAEVAGMQTKTVCSDFPLLGRLACTFSCSETTSHY